MQAADGKRRKLQAADTKGLLRLIQSIPSPNAEPFKIWLAQVGSERLDEIENPVAIREELTDEWKNRGVKEQKEYAILTAEFRKLRLG